MNHGITPNEWERRLDGALTAAEHDRIEAHLVGCLSCWEFYQRMAALNAQLHEAGEAKRESFALSDARLRTGLRNVYTRIHAANASGNSTPLEQRLIELEAVMSIFCGEQTAVNAMHAAAAHSPAQSLKQITRENWEPFLQRLTAIAQVLCGRTGARWLLESGRL